MKLARIYFSILLDPKNAFNEALRQRVGTLFFPLLATILVTGILNVVYYYSVDFNWLLAQLTVGMPEQQRLSMEEALTPGRLVAVSLVGVVALAVLVNGARAFIYWVILKVRGDSQRFVRLFALTMWATAPVALILPAGILNIMLASNGHLTPNNVNPVSLNQLFFGLPDTSGWGALLSSFSLVNVWEVFLVAVGLRAVIALSVARALLIALIPDVVFYGIWAISLLTS